jgi:hypothetical protein
MITKEVTQIERIRDRDGNPRKMKIRKSFAYDFDNRYETCNVTTLRLLGITIFRKTELISYSH